MSGGGSGGPDTITGLTSGTTNSNSSTSGSGSSSTTYPSYVLPYAQQFMNAFAGLAMPGGKVAASPYPYQQVAPWSVPQMQAAQGITSYGQASPLTAGAQQEAAKDLSGQYLSPSSNPQLKNYYDAAADSLVQQYKYATDPSLLAHGAQTGTLVSSPMVQQNQLARYNLGQNLSNLSAQIYEPAYEFERSQQANAMAQSPNLVNSQYIPSQQLWQLGSNMQGQAQNVMNSGYNNLQTLGLWPYQALGMYGNSLGAAAGPGSQTQYAGSTNTTGSTSGSATSTQPNTQQTQGTAICTELYRQGLMDEETWKADVSFSSELDYETIRGYHLWGIPLSKAMRRSKLITRLITPLALCWAREMAYQAKVKSTGSRIGRLLLKVGVPICTSLGRYTSKMRAVPCVSSISEVTNG